MICECCQEEVGARRPYKLDLAGTSPAKMVCMGCFSDLMEAAKTIRDASGRISFAVVACEDIAPVELFGGTEELHLTHVDAGEVDA